ncbi:MAG: hydantoinase/oxoprolinase family protein [Planctomycetaceae bacterium]
MSVLGLDIGGANLKAADETGRAWSEPFEIWRAPGELTARLSALILRFAPCDAVAVTMTAELADCFDTRAQGVDHIVRAVVQAAAGREVRIWSSRRMLVGPAEARAHPFEVAAANWHALATWAGRLAPHGPALLVDIGSTTTDVIPLCDGAPCPTGRTDRERLASGELVYTGVRRTPLCAVTPVVLYRGRLCRVAAELFATALDVHLVRGKLAEEPASTATANGRPATVSAARDRLARMVCSDRDELTHEEILNLADFFAAAQENAVRQALFTVTSRLAAAPQTIVLSGAGEFLARDALAGCPALKAAELISLSERLSNDVAESACAYAVAMLAAARS